MTQDDMDILTTAIDYPEPLTEWEYAWCESVAGREGDFGSLPNISPKERVVLERIETKLEEANLI